MQFMTDNFEQEMATKAMKQRERAEGVVKGRAEEKVAIAKNLVAMGQLSYDLIAQATGLSTGEIAQLATL